LTSEKTFGKIDKTLCLILAESNGGVNGLQELEEEFFVAIIREIILFDEPRDKKLEYGIVSVNGDRKVESSNNVGVVPFMKIIPLMRAFNKENWHFGPTKFSPFFAVMIITISWGATPSKLFDYSNITVCRPSPALDMNLIPVEPNIARTMPTLFCTPYDKIGADLTYEDGGTTYGYAPFIEDLINTPNCVIFGGKNEGNYSGWAELFWSTDGQTFTKFASRTNNSQPFKSQIWWGQFKSGIVTRQGWIFWYGVTGNGRLWLTPDRGATWTAVSPACVDVGVMPQFSWCGVDGDYIIVGSYLERSYGPNKFWLSTDAGLTWTNIYNDDDPYVQTMPFSSISGTGWVVTMNFDTPHALDIGSGFSVSGTEHWNESSRTVLSVSPDRLSLTYSSTKHWDSEAGIMTPSAQNQHIHTAIWKPNTNHTEFYVSRGDSVKKRIYVVKNTNGIWARDPNQVIDQTIYPPMSTTAVSIGKYIYWSEENRGAPTVWKMDTTTNKFSQALMIASEEHGNWYSQEVSTQVAYNIKKCGDLYYLSMQGPMLNRTIIYVSPDCENWAQLKLSTLTESVTTGYYWFAGPLGGYMYTARKDGSLTNMFGEKFTTPTTRLMKAVPAQESITNILTTPNNDSFENDIGDWWGDWLTVSAQAGIAAHGSNCLKGTYQNWGGWEDYIYSPYIDSQCGYTPVADDYISVSARIKLADEADVNKIEFRVFFSVYNGNANSSYYALYTPAATILPFLKDLGGGWYRVAGSMKVLKDWGGKTIDARAIIGATYSKTDYYDTPISFYVDAVHISVSRTQTNTHSILYNYSEGQAVIASEYSIASPLDAPSVMSSQIVWKPVRGAVELKAGEVAVCQFSDAADRKVNLTWTADPGPSRGKFKMSFIGFPGEPNFVESAGYYKPMFEDVVHILFYNDAEGGPIGFIIKAPPGDFSVEDANGAAGDAWTSCKLGAIPELPAAYGIGLYGFVKDYNEVMTAAVMQDLSGSSATFTISGTTEIDGVTMTGLPGDPCTSGGGLYLATVPYNWSGTITPILAGYQFSPESRSYTNVTTDQNDQDYTATLITFTISGTTHMDGVTMNGLPGDPCTSSGGLYSAVVPYGWSDTVTPTKTGFNFNPVSRSYANVTADMSDQDYLIDGGGCINPLSLDWNQDCKVDLIDLAQFASEWMTSGLLNGEECIGRPFMDSNGDCKVDLTDLAQFASEWLQCGLLDQEACFQ
jgi:hypothetical protein